MRPFWHSLQRGLIPITLLALMLSACQSNPSDGMQATATAYAQTSIQQAEQMAKDATLRLCQMDLGQNSEIYTQQLCEVTTEVGCRVLSIEISNQWEAMQARFQSQQLDCDIEEVKFIEDGEQFNLPVQTWWVKAKGTQGWADDDTIHDYFLQLAVEGGQWKLNRVLSDFEVRYYLAQSSAQ